MQVILIFATTHRALAAEKVLLEQRVWYELLPSPRELTLSCGLCLTVRIDDFTQVQKILTEAQAHFTEAYRMPSKVGAPYVPHTQSQDA